MWRLYPKEKALDIYPFIIEEENRNIQDCFSDFSEEERELAYKLVKKMSENIDSKWRNLKNI